MSRLVVDTSVLIRILDRAYTPPSEFAKYDELLIPSVVIGEYRAGLVLLSRGPRLMEALLSYLRKSSVRVVPVGERTAELYAKVYQALRAQGRPIPQNDMWIAAAALEQGADIATHDEHFRCVPMLTVIVPRVDLVDCRNGM